MKDKRYRVWMTQCYAVDIDAKEVQIVSLSDKPLKIKFVGEAADKGNLFPFVG